LLKATFGFVCSEKHETFKYDMINRGGLLIIKIINKIIKKH